MGAIELPARAKVNLTLEVLGKRPDGYHALRSVVMPLAFGDTVRLEELPSGVELEVVAEGVDISALGAAGDNLALRAAELIRQKCGISCGVKITLVKRIPLGGGLGGGSADAAAVLRALNELWKLSLPEAQLVEWGALLGSDVPALVLGGAVLMEGRGEQVARLPGQGEGAPMPVVVANPGIHCSTPEIFHAWNGKQNLTSGGDIVHNIASSVRSGSVRAVANALRNDLQAPAFVRYPEIALLAEKMRKLGCLGVLLSGSGASVFGLVEDIERARRISGELAGVGNWSVATFTCPMV